MYIFLFIIFSHDSSLLFSTWNALCEQSARLVFLLRWVRVCVCVLKHCFSLLSSLRMEKRHLTGPNCSMWATLRPWRSTTTNASCSATSTSSPWTTETRTNALASQDTCLSPWTNLASGNPSLLFSSHYFGKREFEVAVILISAEALLKLQHVSPKKFEL